MLSRRSAVVAVVALAALVGCSKKKGAEAAGGAAPSAGAPAKVKLALNWVPEPEFGGFYAARETGAFREAGLDVDILGGGPGVPVVQMVAAGQADFGIAGADDVVIARARGADVVAVFATFQSSPQGIMVHASRGLKSLAEVFESGTLAMEPGHPYAKWLQKRYGGGAAKIVPYDNGVARFLADPSYAQQCFVTAEPIAARQKGGDPRVFLVAESGYDPYTATVIVRGETLKEKPALVRAFVQATTAGWSSYLADPKPANAVMAKLNPSMDAATFAAAAEAQKPLVETAETRASGLGTMKRERWATLAAQLVELGVVASAPPVESLYADVRGATMPASAK